MQFKNLRATVAPVDVIFEESGAAKSQQHAIVERAIWEVQSTARSLAHACQAHHRVKLPLTHGEDATEYAAKLLNRSQRTAKDNRTAYELTRRKPCRRKLQEIGESAMYMQIATTRHRRSYEDRRDTGILPWIGAAKQHVAGWRDSWCVQSKLHQKGCRHPIQ